VLPGRPTTGCDDFARYLQDAPGCYFRVGAAPASGPVPHHHPKFDLDEAALSVGVEVLLRASLLLLTEAGR
jgi:amidohydrolase